MKAHTDPELFKRWIGPDSLTTRIDQWDCRTLGSYRYVAERDGEEYAFRGSFPYVGEDKLVQTFTWEGMPDGVALETMTFEDLGDGRTRLHTASRCATRSRVATGWLSSGMDVGINEGYAKLDGLLADGAV